MAKKGRPAIKFDLQVVKTMGMFKATYETMADFFECSTKTIERKMHDETGDFCLVYKKAFATTKMKLSETQLKYALAGNTSLLIWLGKIYLGQKEPDKYELDNNQTVDFTFEII